MKRLSRHISSIFVLALATCALAVAEAPPQGDSVEAAEAAIHAAVANWSAAAQAKDPESFVSVYAPDAVLMLEGAPDPTGREAILATISGMMQDPNFSLSFETKDVVVAGSGDLAYETGIYSLSLSDPAGNPVSQAGHYVVVWRMQSDGQWKVVLDSPVSDPAEVAAGD